jgi:uncharacterized oxidoreductase
MKITGNKILITGGASGIGLGMAGKFLEEGNEVIICGRRDVALKDASGKFPGLVTRRCDLTVKAEREALFNWISDNHNDMNVLINNAGIQQRMSLDDPDFYKRAKEEIAINIEAQVHIILLFLDLKSLNTIINVTSGLAFAPMTRVAVYSATKAFFHSFTLSLREMVRERDIEVIELIPPAVNTDLGGKGAHLKATPVDEFISAAFEKLRQGGQEISYGFSEAMLKAGPLELKQAFERMNRR